MLKRRRGRHIIDFVDLTAIMYKNFVTFSKLCECPQSLVRVLASPIPCLPKLNPVSQGFHSTCSSNSSRGNTVVKNLVANHLTSKINNKNSSNQFYCQTRRQHVYFPMQRPNWGGSFSSPADSHRCYFSTSVPEVLEGTRPIQFWGHETEPFGTLNIDTPFHVVIKPLNPEKYPEMNRAFVRLFAPGSEEDEGQENSTLSHWSDLYTMETSFVKDQLTLTGKIPKAIFGDCSPQITCLVEIPIKFNVNVKVEGQANVSLSDMESDDIFIRCQHGNCQLKNVKSGKIDVYCETGSLESSGFLQGNIRLGCGNDGMIKAQRLQGQNISCRTVSGNMDIADIYAKETMITASEKTILNLGSCHGKALININSGNINIKSVEGNLEAITQMGEVHVALTNTKKKVYVCSKRGDVSIGLPKPADMDLDLLAAGIQLTKDFTYLVKSLVETTDQAQLLLMALEETVGEKGGSKVTGDAKVGILTIKYQDWLSSIGLKADDNEK